MGVLGATGEVFPRLPETPLLFGPHDITIMLRKRTPAESRDEPADRISEAHFPSIG
jgi:hypothetical protein